MGRASFFQAPRVRRTSTPPRMNGGNRGPARRMARRSARSIAASVLVRGELALLVLAPHEVVIRIERSVAGRPVADLEIDSRVAAAIDEMVRVPAAGRIAGA